MSEMTLGELKKYTKGLREKYERGLITGEETRQLVFANKILRAAAEGQFDDDYIVMHGFSFMPREAGK